ncbi:FAD/NAD(P)-binding domain-containing protein [Rhizodiscina lignyota]|uniref:FAD/NAD(P)-binding domain-containing protein n=1 Tax=Rhizodiscina lignyota TaxID=1504668 RepID=A0A9P4I4E5_9PEZI|nr:FAD/NAD(P)-binding domain-containing protein [Rhizodiscina lignyota]
MSTPHLKVLISGAGIAGPCLAYWLARTRLRTSITIVERSRTPRVTGQAIDIHGSAIEILKRMNLLDAVRSCYTTEEGTAFLDSSGKAIAQFGAGENFTAQYEILRGDLSRLLLEATETSDNIKYVYGDPITSLKQTDSDINVTFAGGSEDTFDLVVAADGATSSTRPMILDEQILKDGYKFLGQYNAFFSIPSRPDDSRMWQIYNLRKGLCIMKRPHRNPSTMGSYLCITMPARGRRDPTVEDAMDKGADETKRMLHSYFDDAGWEAKRVLEAMDHAEDFYMSRAAQVKLPKWSNGRAVLLGDAAWATFGSGTTLAIGGAYMLAGELSRIQSSSDIPQALKRYEEIFRPIYTKMEDPIPGFPQIMFPQTALGLGVRDSALWFLSKTKVYKLFGGGPEIEWELQSYDWADV